MQPPADCRRGSNQLLPPSLEDDPMHWGGDMLQSKESVLIQFRFVVGRWCQRRHCSFLHKNLTLDGAFDPFK
eukprot:4290151-Ditylum_brightwellii.AAC.2